MSVLCRSDLMCQGVWSRHENIVLRRRDLKCRARGVGRGVKIALFAGDGELVKSMTAGLSLSLFDRSPCRSPGNISFMKHV